MPAFVSLPVRKYRKSYCITAVSAAALTKMLKFYVKVFKMLHFLNPEMDFVYIWYDYKCGTKILLGTIPTPAYDFEVKVTDLEILC